MLLVFTWILFSFSFYVFPHSKGNTIETHCQACSGNKGIDKKTLRFSTLLELKDHIKTSIPHLQGSGTITELGIERTREPEEEVECCVEFSFQIKTIYLGRKTIKTQDIKKELK